jgi:hypothetical protein
MTEVQKVEKKAAKKQPKTIWEQVHEQDKDYFFFYLEKKVRNLNKKLKDITQLEELSQTKELRPEQVEKVNSKEAHIAKVLEWESFVEIWRDAKKEDK